MTPHAPHAPACPGCLGSGECWVCLGTGHLGPDTGQRCRRCAGSGVCAEASDSAVAERQVS